MDAGARPLGLPMNVLTMILESMYLSDRFTCALVCKAWAEAATAATRGMSLWDVQDLSCLQCWLVKYGHQVEIFQLRQCPDATLTALPCPQLQDLLLSCILSIDSRVWSDIAAATKLTSVSLATVHTASRQADVVSALTALPGLEQLSWYYVRCSGREQLSDSVLLQKLTKLTALKLEGNIAEAALEHLGLLTRLQALSLCVTHHWVAAAGCPGLQELKALTRLHLVNTNISFPHSISQLTALQQLYVPRATPTALNNLTALTGLTRLHVWLLEGMLPESPPPQLPDLQHLDVDVGKGTMPMSYFGCCTQLRVLELCGINLSGPGSLVASSMLQHLELKRCKISAADRAACPVSWQQVFPGPGRLPHLTSLKMTDPIDPKPVLQHAGMERVAVCCSNVQEVHVDNVQDNISSALARLSGLTSLRLFTAND